MEKDIYPRTLAGAAQEGKVESVIAHLLEGEDPNERWAWTPLGYAVGGGFLECVKILLVAGADPRMPFIKGEEETALERANALLQSDESAKKRDNRVKIRDTLARVAERLNAENAPIPE